MNIFSFAQKSTETVLKEFHIQQTKGLSSSEAQKRTEQYGKNELSANITHWWQILGRQFTSPFIYLLIGAAILAFILQEYIDGSLVLLFLLINTGLGFSQEYRSEKTLQLLKSFVIAYTQVRRDGKIIPISSTDIVPGDILVLETGNKIPADVRFIETYDLTVDETVLTGESISVHKTSDAIAKPAKQYHQALNLGFSGTTILNGKAEAVVLATGRDTAIGQITRKASEVHRVSDFEKGINGFSKFILKLMSITLVFIFAANILLRRGTVNYAELTLFAITLAVSVIPEALPVITTFSLARGAKKLAKQKVVVKRLSAVEDLGGIEILCSDKTGTLTENKLTVAEIYPQSRENFMLYANLASSQVATQKLEPFDVALWKKLPETQRRVTKAYTQILEEPFNPHSRRNIVLVEYKNKKEVITRGAPEVIMDLCGLTRSEKETMKAWVATQGKAGKRTLAVATKVLKSKTGKEPNIQNEKKGFKFLGMVSFVDPIKPSTFEAVKQSKQLKVQIKMITGDSAEVAGAVGHEIGLTNAPEEVITAEALEALPHAQYEKAIETYHVFARVSPEQKFSIIESLQKKYSVGFLGEGINDVAALKMAGVSLVVESAADVARDAADIILMKKNLKVILDGIHEGRLIFSNTTKYIKATLTSNFGNFFAVSIASLLIDFLPMLPLQILLVNLLSDFPMIAISTDTVDPNELHSPKKYNIKDIALIAICLGIISTVFDFVFFGLFFRISPEVLQTNWFIGSIITELLFLFSIRTRRVFFKASRPSAMMFFLTISAAIVTVIIPFLGFGKTIFHFTPPSMAHMIIIFSIVITYFIVTEIVKVIYYRTIGSRTEKISN